MKFSALPSANFRWHFSGFHPISTLLERLYIKHFDDSLRAPFQNYRFVFQFYFQLSPIPMPRRFSSFESASISMHDKHSFHWQALPPFCFLLSQLSSQQLDPTSETEPFVAFVALPPSNALRRSLPNLKEMRR